MRIAPIDASQLNGRQLVEWVGKFGRCGIVGVMCHGEWALRFSKLASSWLSFCLSCLVVVTLTDKISATAPEPSLSAFCHAPMVVMD